MLMFFIYGNLELNLQIKFLFMESTILRNVLTFLIGDLNER